MHPLLTDVKNIIYDTLFPIQCLGCNQEGLFLCLQCQNKLQRLTHQQCIICRMPSANGLTHQRCCRNDTPDSLISAFDYNDPLLDQAIIWGKYKFLPDMYRLLGQLLVDYLEQNNYLASLADAIICPVPLAKERLRWRGFNQSEIIATELSKHFHWLMTPLIKRTKNTKTQKDLTKAERIANISQSFAVIDDHKVQNKNVILIDDVITTGATLLEASKLLKLNGASQVWCLTLARD